MQVHVVEVPWPTHNEQLRAVRDEVFIQEQGVPKDVEWDGQDEDAIHFLALNQAGQAVGCARLLPSGQIGRMAVLAEHRSLGIGNRLLEAALQNAKQQNFSEVFLHAQAQVTEFYHKAGFRLSGNEFVEAGIPHVAMNLELPIRFEPVGGIARPEIRKQGSELDSEKAEFEQLHGESECRTGLLKCLQEPLRTVQIYSQYLDHDLFDQLAVVDALSAFVRRGPPVQLQVLIHSSQLIISRGHRLLELARRLDNKVQIRRVPEELTSDLHTSVVWDARGYWLMPDYREYEGLANIFDPVQAARLTQRFDYLWHKASEDSELRVLRM